MTNCIQIFARAAAAKASGKAIRASEPERQKKPREISRAEIRHRQVSLVNAMLCCMI